MMLEKKLLEDLPGGDIITAGLMDLSCNLETIPGLLVSIGAPRLHRVGIEISNPISSPEIKLYQQLSQDNPNGAHSRYNALIRRLVSFERAVECAN